MHRMTYNAATQSAICTCRMVLMLDCTQAEAEQFHLAHVAAEQAQPTSPTTLRLAQLGRSKWSGYYKSERTT